MNILNVKNAKFCYDCAVEEGLVDTHVPGDHTEEHINMLAEKYGWTDIETAHALENLDNDYGEECVIQLANGRVIHTDSFPNECTYVRIVQDGYELAYWVVDEWADDPSGVMGAILGCAKGN